MKSIGVSVEFLVKKGFTASMSRFGRSTLGFPSRDAKNRGIEYHGDSDASS